MLEVLYHFYASRKKIAKVKTRVNETAWSVKYASLLIESNLSMHQSSAIQIFYNVRMTALGRHQTGVSKSWVQHVSTVWWRCMFHIYCIYIFYKDYYINNWLHC